MFWRKELRARLAEGPVRYRGGLGQVIEVGAPRRLARARRFSAMFDRVHHPARGRRGGAAGAATTIALDDGTAMKGKGKQFVPHGRRVCMAFPGGAGYGAPGHRSASAVQRDLALGYISPEAAKADYGMSDRDIEAVLTRARKGEPF